MRTKRSFDKFRMTDEFWERVKVLLPRYPVSPKGGRPRADLRRVVDGSFYLPADHRTVMRHARLHPLPGTGEQT